MMIIAWLILFKFCQAYPVTDSEILLQRGNFRQSNESSPSETSEIDQVEENIFIPSGTEQLSVVRLPEDNNYRNVWKVTQTVINLKSNIVSKEQNETSKISNMTVEVVSNEDLESNFDAITTGLETLATEIAHELVVPTETAMSAYNHDEKILGSETESIPTSKTEKTITEKIAEDKTDADSIWMDAATVQMSSSTADNDNIETIAAGIKDEAIKTETESVAITNENEAIVKTTMSTGSKDKTDTDSILMDAVTAQMSSSTADNDNIDTNAAGIKNEANAIESKHVLIANEEPEIIKTTMLTGSEGKMNADSIWMDAATAQMSSAVEEKEFDSTITAIIYNEETVVIEKNSQSFIKGDKHELKTSPSELTSTASVETEHKITEDTFSAIETTIISDIINLEKSSKTEKENSKTEITEHEITEATSSTDKKIIESGVVSEKNESTILSQLETSSKDAIMKTDTIEKEFVSESASEALITSTQIEPTVFTEPNTSLEVDKHILTSTLSENKSTNKHAPENLLESNKLEINHSESPEQVKNVTVVEISKYRYTDTEIYPPNMAGTKIEQVTDVFACATEDTTSKIEDDVNPPTEAKHVSNAVVESESTRVISPSDAGSTYKVEDTNKKEMKENQNQNDTYEISKVRLGRLQTLHAMLTETNRILRLTQQEFDNELNHLFARIEPTNNL